MKLSLERNNSTYTIEPFPDSTWRRVLKDGKFLALVIEDTTAFQVIFRDVGDGVFLSESDFEVER